MNTHKPKHHTQDGWDPIPDHEEYTATEEEVCQSDNVRYRGDKALSILQAKHHSLEPDMISGWRPKLPSCPLPLCYPNLYVDSVMQVLGRSDLYSVVYVGQRYVNSVQINQQYNYYWKYRERYSLNLAIVQNAIKTIGIPSDSPPPTKLSSTIPSSLAHTFSSEFQSGNLDLAVRVRKNQYDCFIRSDTNTKGHTNWYYFSMSNSGGEIGQVKVNVCNMTKCRNLYMKGMKPYVRIGGDGVWSQELCTDVVFVERYCRYGFDRKTYQLQFCFNFTQPNQTVYFAYSVPYTFTDLQNFIKQIKQTHPNLVTTRKLCQSLGGIQLPLLTITNPTTDQPQNSPQNTQQNPTQSPILPILSHKKKAILLTARIHPGESNSSHMIEGFIRELLDDTEASNVLRSMFVFYVVPMLNPDGVVAGNFRTSFSGKDLNRQFNKLNKFLFPEITALCEFCQNVKKSSLRGVEFYFDFHGHSAKKNLFCYGPQHPTSKIYFFKCRALAKIIQRISPIFSYKKSIFTISEQKRNTARAYMLRTLKIPMTFTFQISNGLYQNQQRQNILLNRKILLHTGSILLKSLYRYAQLQMKIPKKCIKAKVDTGKFKKRHLNSAGACRRSDNTLKKKNLQESSETRLGKGVSVDKSTSLEKEKQKDKEREKEGLEDSKEFMQLMKQIRQQQQQHNQQLDPEIQGGSDSQSQADDFTKQQQKQLFQQIIKRQTNPNNYLIRQKKKPKQSKLQPIFKQQRQRQTNQNTNRDQANLPPYPPPNPNSNAQSRKFRSSRMIELSKPPLFSSKNIGGNGGNGGKRGVSVEYERIVLAQKNFTMLL